MVSKASYGQREAVSKELNLLWKIDTEHLPFYLLICVGDSENILIFHTLLLILHDILVKDSVFPV